MSLELTIRDYADSDWEAICRVHDRARPIELACDSNFTGKTRVRSLAEAAEADGFFDSRTVVAVAGGRVVGFASINQAYLSFLYVDPEFHRQGVGRALLANVAPQMGHDGYTNVLATNTPAIAFYIAAGMEVTGRFFDRAEGMPCACLRLGFNKPAQL
ncbi:MAG TPA: GNAT family N-acetyltransferase [Tepidisphaeraceae bacterium]|jgi:ribosomal protein S18 acetylase RimI-like enzyme|nr:GNAT family N-acetyltransferase [Tepidisphaeraceae bacterium]